MCAAGAEHWEKLHAAKSADGVSWWQNRDDLWLDLVEELALAPAAPVVDIGSGSSLFVEALLELGFTDLTAVDISRTALHRIEQRLQGLGAGADAVHLVASDVRAYRSPTPVALWHDRAVFHFLTDESDTAAYREALRACLAPGGHVIVATFAPDGPQTCSGLPVRRYSAAALTEALGFEPSALLRAERRVHITPWGSQQPFTVVVLTSAM